MIITPEALYKLEELRKSFDFLCVSIVGGGCSGLSYQMKWQSPSIPYDSLIFDNGFITIVTDSKSSLFLQDIQLGYDDGLNGTGFVWNNPNAKRVCGCGTSFSV